MTRVGRYKNPYRSVDFEGEAPAGGSCALLGLETEDFAAAHAALWMPTGSRPKTAVMVMHPRADFLRHYAIPGLLDAGYAVLAQNSRWAGNDSMLVHEQVLLDVAAGVRRLRDLGFERVVAIGNSGGGSLYAFYAAQATAPAGTRLRETAAGDSLDLNCFDMPTVDAIVFLGAHPGEGLFLLHAIDPSVANEGDPLSCDESLDMYAARNGFRAPPQPTRYDATFVARYRAAQRTRVERLDTLARTIVDARRLARERSRLDPNDAAEMRRATSVPFLTIYRTEADPRYVDTSIDASERDYGSLFGRRPDVINYGPFGFARVVSPEAWLSTWSGLSSRASIPANGPSLQLPALVVSYSADNAVFPSDARAIHDVLGSKDKTFVQVRGDHYGFAIAGSEKAPSSSGGGEPGRDAAVRHIVGWMRERGL